ncbi:MAG: group II intron reverse transcriptase/maturase, partial [Pseudobdellovibrionaceae bacterium]|nr:group II intron reverse transcriptase/maturase [Pseudobdellovibrionaceae bacterium]
MTAVLKPLTGAPSTSSLDWDSIDWPHIEQNVRRLQIRIAKATKEGRFGKVKALQWLLTHSFEAKLLATKRVTENKGGKTPGIDGKTWIKGRDKVKGAISLKRRGYNTEPLRRVYIPKKNGKQRPLGIPTIRARAMQALHLLGLEPVTETLADRNSYGFRIGRSCADAIEQCFNIFCRKTSAQWVFEGDIKSCFDQISHEWLLNNTPMDQEILGKWLKSGYIDKGRYHETRDGTPQGGIVSPALLNLTLRGLEAEIKKATRTKDLVNVVVYADDFIVSARTRKILETKVKPTISKFLSERGLLLSEEKTLITHIDQGFDFLGFNVKRYKNQVLTKPAKKSIKSFLLNIRDCVEANKTAKTENLIKILNPKIIGWANYYKSVVSKNIFSYVDHQIFWSLWRWAKRRHPNRSKGWIWNKYFHNTFKTKNILNIKSCKPTGEFALLAKASSVPIVRHIKIKADANPFDPKYHEYFSK